MSGFEDIREHMEVIGADGVHLGTVDRIERNVQEQIVDHFVDGRLVFEASAGRNAHGNVAELAQDDLVVVGHGSCPGASSRHLPP